MQALRDDETGSRIPRGDKYLLDAVMAAPLAAVAAVNLVAWRAAVKMLMVVHRGTSPGLSRWMMAMIFVIGWVLLKLDPGAGLTWFLD